MIRLYAIFILLVMTNGAYAQGIGDLSQPSPAHWQASVEVIKLKAYDLLQVNNQLSAQYQDLNAQVVNLQEQLARQQSHNDAMRALLKERKGRSDQQVMLDDANRQLKAVKLAHQGQSRLLEDSKKKLADIDRKINLKKLKINEWQLRHDKEEVEAQLKKAQEVKAAGLDNQLGQLRKSLEDNKAQEALLESQIEEYKVDDTADGVELANVQRENKRLEEKLNLLRLRNQEVKAPSFAKERYELLRQRKADLEAKIKVYEEKADALRMSLLKGGDWVSRKKQLVKQMVQMDNRNTRLRENINALREDIDLLRDQVAKLERRVNFMKGK